MLQSALTGEELHLGGVNYKAFKILNVVYSKKFQPPANNPSRGRERRVH